MFIADSDQQIFNELNPAESACLGLTYKLFYPIHRAIHGIVSLSTFCYEAPWGTQKMVPVSLGAVLHDWAREKLSYFSIGGQRSNLQLKCYKFMSWTDHIQRFDIKS